MKSRVRSILGTGIAFCLAAFNLPVSAQTATQFGNLPLWFEAASPAHFIAHGANSEFVITASGTEFHLAKADGESAGGCLRLVGAAPNARIAGENQLTGKVNYLTGNNPSQWRTRIPTFSQVQVKDVYPGINVVYYGNQRKLEYNFNLAAGANPDDIALRFDGAENISVNRQHELVIQFKTGTVVQHPPLAYQMIAGQRHEIAASYKLLDQHTAAFVLGNFDHAKQLVIDPVLTYSTYYGGNNGENAWAIAVNPTDGSIYVAGQTLSSAFTNGIPFSTSNALQTTFAGGSAAGDAFIARFDQTGTNLIYATYLGGTADDAAYALAVDSSGHAFLAGITDSSDFPTTNAIKSGSFDGAHITGSFNPHFGYYPFDAFVSELNTNGSHLIYSTYLGGNNTEAAFGIALDAANNAYVTGFTFSTNFPVSTNAFQSFLACSNTLYYNANAFISKISAGGTNLSYSTYFGGTNFDVGRAIAVNNNRVFVAGYTYSTNFPNTNSLSGFDHLNGSSGNGYYPGSDAFVSAFASSATNLALLYSTFLGGWNYDAATSIAASSDGSAYVAGYTTSTNFPYTTTNVPYLPTAFVLTNTVSYYATNGFLTQIKWNGTHPTIGYSAVFGGWGWDVANGVALDPEGNAYVVGSASSTNFPATTNNISGFLSATNNSQANRGYSDAFVIAFNTNATALLYSAYIGGYLQDYGNAIAVDPLGNAYIAGQTLSTNFPTVNARQYYRNGTNDMFIAKISQTLAAPAPSLTISPKAAAPSDISLKWQMFPANYDLENANYLGTGNWSVVPQTPVYSNGWYQVVLPTTNSQEFFRLHQN